METITRHALPKVGVQTIDVTSKLVNSPKPADTGPPAFSDPSVSQETKQRDSKYLLGLREGAPLAFAAYTVAIEYHSKLSNRTLHEEEVLDILQKLAPKSAFQIEYVARQAVKLINPHGHGANSRRFMNETLGWFRHTHPEYAHLTAGLTLLICAAIWWTNEQGHRSITPRVNPLTTSDLDKKLKSFGFLSGERQAICRMLRRDTGR